MNKHIFFSVAGIRPAIIMESIYGLREQGICAGEIHLLTTLPGYEKMQVLLDSQGYVAEFNRLWRTDWQIRQEWIKVTLDRENCPLKDLRTTADNMAVADHILRCVRDWTTQSGITLHASVAGGRKTMGLFLMQAMHWFARPQDTLSHVLVAEHIEQDDSFCYPLPDNPAHQKIIDFAPIEFIRLRGLLPTLIDLSCSYSEITRKMQVYLNDTTNAQGHIYIDIQMRRLNIEGQFQIQFEPVSLGLFLFLFECANLARDQKPFQFNDAFDFRHKLSACFKRVGVSARQMNPCQTQFAGLSGLSADESEWPKHWRHYVGEKKRDANSERCKELQDAFGKLNARLRETGWADKASFRVMSDRRPPNRWVNIHPSRVTLLP